MNGGDEAENTEDENGGIVMKGCLSRDGLLKIGKFVFRGGEKKTRRGFFVPSFVSLVCRRKIAFCRGNRAR